MVLPVYTTVPLVTPLVCFWGAWEWGYPDCGGIFAHLFFTDTSLWFNNGNQPDLWLFLQPDNQPAIVHECVIYISCSVKFCAGLCLLLKTKSIILTVQTCVYNVAIVTVHTNITECVAVTATRHCFSISLPHLHVRHISATCILCHTIRSYLKTMSGIFLSVWVIKGPTTDIPNRDKVESLWFDHTIGRTHLAWWLLCNTPSNYIFSVDFIHNHVPLCFP